MRDAGSSEFCETGTEPDPRKLVSCGSKQLLMKDSLMGWSVPGLGVGIVMWVQETGLQGSRFSFQRFAFQT